uniref:Uncharacterized protein n=1 Tax=Strigamia maritima TaxID=126957 RepID=T1JJ65_STRMM
MSEEQYPNVPNIKDTAVNFPNNNTQDDIQLDWDILSRKSSSAESGLAESDDLGISWDQVLPVGKNARNVDDDENVDASQLSGTVFCSEFRSECLDGTSYSDSDEDNFFMDFDDVRRCETITEEDDDDESRLNSRATIIKEETNDEWGLCGKRSGSEVTLRADNSNITSTIDLNSPGIREETPHVGSKIETCLLNLEESIQLNEIELTMIPEALLLLNHLQILYLSNNQITSLPPSFFSRLSKLRWLDLRHNQLNCLPWNIGEHSNLTTLLLEGNRLTILPPELGLVPNLRGLNIRNNPLVDPPENILNLGLHGILHYLRQKIIVLNEQKEEDENES